MFIVFASTSFAEEEASANYFNVAKIEQDQREKDRIEQKKLQQEAPKYAVVVSMKKCNDYLKGAGLYYNKKYKACLRQKSAMADAERIKAKEIEAIEGANDENDE